ncbi:hypothetical protein [Dactylosporangium sp. CA-139066]
MLGALATATTLPVFKPWGRTGRGYAAARSGGKAAGIAGAAAAARTDSA